MIFGKSQRYVSFLDYKVAVDHDVSARVSHQSSATEFRRSDPSSSLSTVAKCEDALFYSYSNGSTCNIL